MNDVPPLRPWDAHNRRLHAHVHPTDWVNPSPSPRYNLVVIGGGTAGLVTAAGAAGLGAKVALIERHLLGGDCLNVGCVPSKALIRAARAAADARTSERFGVKLAGPVTVDFPAVMERMRRLRADLSPHDSAARFRELGVDVFIGDGKFTSPTTIAVGDQTLRFAKAVIATGARASAPPIAGLADVPYLTNETLFSLTELPRRLAIVGAGPIGCEMAQSFARFGSEVTLIESAAGLLPREDRDAAALLRTALERDGVQILCNGKDLKVSRHAEGIRWELAAGRPEKSGIADQLLVAVGRAPNVENLGLDVAGVRFGKKGVEVNECLQTSNADIFACGDVCSRYQFTHAADFMARIVIQNALFKGRRRATALTIPWATYTSPEVAHVGLTAPEAAAQGVALDTFTQSLAKVDRAILDGEDEGFVRVHVRKGTDQIIGATIVAAHAGDMIGELSLAMTNKLGLGAIGASIHPYPTQAEAIRKVGDLYSRTRLTPLVKRLFAKWLAWQRS
jgi:pyruvate/2-oxoglutarate dehydrogenase complex dihydrolipoamide dehydrogenase (E3) component